MSTARVDAYDWDDVARQLDAQGWAVLPQLLDSDECAAIAALYGPGTLFAAML